MRYYGMSDYTGENAPQGVSREQDFAPIENERASNGNFERAAIEDKTFNRPEGQSGIYRGQRAQNVRAVGEAQNEIKAPIFPPMGNQPFSPMENVTLYEYPTAEKQRACPKSTDIYSYLCSRLGKVLRVELGGGVTKSGFLTEVLKSYIILTEEGSKNTIVLAAESIKSIDIFA